MAVICAVCSVNVFCITLLTDILTALLASAGSLAFLIKVPPGVFMLKIKKFSISFSRLNSFIPGDEKDLLYQPVQKAQPEYAK